MRYCSRGRVGAGRLREGKMPWKLARVLLSRGCAIFTNKPD